MPLKKNGRPWGRELKNVQGKEKKKNKGRLKKSKGGKHVGGGKKKRGP